MIIVDKAAWHIDSGENKESVINRFKILFCFLNNHSLLSKEGKELYEFGIDSSVSLHDGLLTTTGLKIIEKHYNQSLTISLNLLDDYWNRIYQNYVNCNSQ